jgi:hypothetical protein
MYLITPLINVNISCVYFAYLLVVLILYLFLAAISFSILLKYLIKLLSVPSRSTDRYPVLYAISANFALVIDSSGLKLPALLNHPFN